MRKYDLRPTKRDIPAAVAGVFAVLAAVMIVHLIGNHKTPLSPEASTVTAKWIPSTVKHYEKDINEIARQYDIDPNLIAIIITMESGGYAKAKSGVGAEGLMQIMPETAKDIAARYVNKPRKNYNLQDPRTNIEFGTAYLAMLRDEYGTAKQGPDWNGTVELIAAAYNGGFVSANNLEQGNGMRSEETVVYSRDAFNMWRERHAQKSPTFDRWKERGGVTLLEQAKNSN